MHNVWIFGQREASLMKFAKTTRFSVRRGGFGLIELLVVMAVTLVGLGIAWPSYQYWLETAQLKDRADALVAALNLARSEAIKRGGRVDVCKSTDARQCAAYGDWSSGWITYTETEDPAAAEPGIEILRTEGQGAARMSVQANRPLEDYVSYTSLGHARKHDGALQMGTFVVCRNGHRALHVVMANSGRLRVERTQNACP